MRHHLSDWIIRVGFLIYIFRVTFFEILIIN
jgi:hypothetical protein